MALENLISVAFTEAELTQLDQAISSIETVLQGKTINLTPEQRQQYGSIAEQNKLFVNKAKSYMEQYPQFVPLFLDKAEYDRDYAARQQLESRMQRLSSVTEQLSDTKILLDFDNYHNSITFYRNMKYLSGENVPGTNVIYDDMKQFFVTTSTTPTPPTENQSEGS
jgi:methyl coenzyme M reductase subunit C-like uncharacterized protein (methanogenesis marker protein 7)